MAIPRFAWGIDIGNHALKAVRLSKVGERLVVDDFDYVEHEVVLSEAGDNKEDLIRQALTTFAARKKTRGGAVAVGVSGQASFARFVKLPPVDQKKIPEIVKFEAIQQIPFPLDDVEWSFQLFQDEDSPDTEVGIFAMRKELVNRHISFFTDVDLDVQVVQTSPLAVYNAAAYDGLLRDGTAMIVDLGAENTDLIIADENSIWLRTIPIGGNQFTETLTKAFKVSFTKAEELKRNAKSSKYARQIFQAMRPVFADLVSEIQRSMGFYSSTHREKEISKIIAVGGTFRLPGLQKYVQQNIQLPVQRPDSLLAGAPEDAKAAAKFSEHLLSGYSSYGLALQAMGEAQVSASLLPASIRREKMWQDKTKWFATAAALFVAAAAVPVVSIMASDMAWKENREDRSENQRVLAEANGLISEWTSKVEGQGESARLQYRNVMDLTAGKNLLADLLADLSAAVPKPTGALAEALAAENAEQVKAAEANRGQREVFRIHSIVSEYRPNLSEVLSSNTGLGSFTPASAGGLAGERRGGGTRGRGGELPPEYGGSPRGRSGTGPGGENPLVRPGQTPRGYIMDLTIITPLQSANEVVRRQIIPSLLSIRPDAQRPAPMYAVARAEQVRYNDLDRWPDIYQEMMKNQEAALALKARLEAIESGELPNASGRRSPTGGRFNPNEQPGRFGEQDDFGRGGQSLPNFTRGGRNTTPARQEVRLLDRLTGEPMEKDKALTIRVVVLLDPAPYEPPAIDEDAEQAAADDADADARDNVRG
ncbi:MAG: type IV pilus assembly protein PilM [Phycisphaerae bacterium]